MQVQLDLTSKVAGTTQAHPAGVAAVLLLGLALLTVKRRWAALPILALACFVPSGQRIVIATLDFSFLRIMVLIGWMRVFMKNEYAGYRRHPMDVVLVSWAIVRIVAFTSLRGTTSSLILMLGTSFDMLGMYFLFRFLIRDWIDLDRLVKSLAIISVPVAMAFMYEKATSHNLFSALGGVPERTVVRMGRLRCQGAYSHPILAGCFWAALLPMMACAWWRGNLTGKIEALIGVGCGMLVIFASSSSTPVLGVGFALMGGLFFVVRRRLTLIRWGTVALLVLLHLVMKAPVWHLVSRVSAVGGSTGHHRYALIDNAIRRFPEWALRGLVSTRHWGFGMGDVTNQYVAEGKRAGALGLLLFVMLIAYAFRGVGRLWRRSHGRRYQVALSWALGTSIFVHCGMFIGVGYFGQIWAIWYMILAAIGSMELRTETSVRVLQRSQRVGRPVLVR